jgi:putative Holliday junction resolvase
LICIGVDPGENRVGLALGIDSLAIALESVTREHAINRILEVASEKQASRIYVGLPINLKSQVTPATEKALAFAKELANAVGLPLLLIDERLTTSESAKKLRSAGISSRENRDSIDAESARLIVQSAIACNHQCGIELEEYHARRV